MKAMARQGWRVVCRWVARAAVADDARPACDVSASICGLGTDGWLGRAEDWVDYARVLADLRERVHRCRLVWGFLRTIETVPVSWASIPSDDYMRSASISLRCTALSFDTLLLTAPELTTCDRQTAQDVCRVKDASSSHI